MQCNAGSVAVGIYGRYGSYVDQLGLVCAYPQANGSFGPSYTTYSVGGNGGYSFYDLCPVGNWLAGLTGASGSYIDTIGIKCASLAAPIGSKPNYAMYGGGGGSGFDDTCPKSYGITYMNVAGGSFIDSIQAQCSYLQP